MALIARKKKTFGIKNKKWLERIGIANLLSLFIAYVMLMVEIYFDWKGPKALWKLDLRHIPSGTLFLHFHGTLYLEIFVSILILRSSAKINSFSLKILSILVPVTAIIVFFSLLKPIPDEYLQAFYSIEEIHIYHFMIKPFVHWIVLFNSTIATWILWKMRRFELDQEPCEVIYGGEDSSTKKLLKVI